MPNQNKEYINIDINTGFFVPLCNSCHVINY